MSQASGAARQEPKPGKGQAKDPVCGMDVDPASAKEKTKHEGQTYYFCSAQCREEFEQDPERYS